LDDLGCLPCADVALVVQTAGLDTTAEPLASSWLRAEADGMLLVGRQNHYETQLGMMVKSRQAASGKGFLAARTGRVKTFPVFSCDISKTPVVECSGIDRRFAIRGASIDAPGWLHSTLEIHHDSHVWFVGPAVLQH